MLPALLFIRSIAPQINPDAFAISRQNTTKLTCNQCQGNKKDKAVKFL